MMMMMLGEPNQQNPTVHAPPWALLDESMAGMDFHLPVSGVSGNVNVNGDGEYSPFMLNETLSALQQYLPSNDIDSELDNTCRETDIPVDAYSSDEFRMYEFKVRRCARGRSHDWTECPFAHPGEKARRRDPRKYHYSGTACPDFRKGICKRADSCEFAHGVFECWLHPARYRTQPCKDGTNCRRRVCFFAHTPEQLRILPQQNMKSPAPAESYDGSPLRQALDSYYPKGSFMASPTSTLISPPISPSSESPPMSPLSRSLGSSSINDVVSSMRNMQLNKVKSIPPWGVKLGSGFVSPRASSGLRPSFCSLPSTPADVQTRPGNVFFDSWEKSCEEEPVMERVESGRDLRAQIFAKLSKENSLEREPAPVQAPDVRWVSELVNDEHLIWG